MPNRPLLPSEPVRMTSRPALDNFQRNRRSVPSSAGRTPKKEAFREQLVRLCDVSYVEDLGDETNPTFSNAIMLLVQSHENRVKFQIPLAEEHVRSLTGLPRAMTSKEMIDYCKWLDDQCGRDIRLIVPEGATEVTADSLAEWEKNRRKVQHEIADRVEEASNRLPVVIDEDALAEFDDLYDNQEAIDADSDLGDDDFESDIPSYRDRPGEHSDEEDEFDETDINDDSALGLPPPARDSFVVPQKLVPMAQMPSRRDIRRPR